MTNIVKMENQKLINRIETTADIFEICTEIYDDIIYIGSVNAIEKEIIESSNFLMRQIELEWRLLILELKKIFNKKEYYSLLNILNFLLSNHKKIKWENALTKNELNQFLDELQSMEIQDAEKTLTGIRNRVVAHLDKNRSKFDDKISLNQIKSLMDFGKRVINKINLSLTGSEFEFNHLTFSGLETMVNKIAELQEKN